MPRVGYSRRLVLPRWSGPRTSYSIGDNRYTATAAGFGLAEDNGPFELQQAYVTLGNLKQFPLLLKVGRQELVYGEQRLVGSFLWNNSPRTFDAVKVRYQDAFFGVDLFTGGVVYNRHDHLNQATRRMSFPGPMPELSPASPRP